MNGGVSWDFLLLISITLAAWLSKAGGRRAFGSSRPTAAAAAAAAAGK